MTAILKSLLKSVLGWLTGELGWVALLGLGAAGAAIYVHVRAVTADRDALLAWSRLACAAAGQEFDASADAQGAKHARGDLCRQRISALAKFRADTADATAATLAAARDEHDARAAADREAASSNERDQRADQARMETENGKVETDDRVDGNWFGAFDNLAGLRRPAR